MAKKDLATKIDIDAKITSGTTIVDTQGCESLVFTSSVISGTTYTLEHGDDSGLSDGVTVGADFLIGDAAYTASGTGKIGYVGKKRYVQITVGTPATDTTIVAIKGNLLRSPVGS